MKVLKDLYYTKEHEWLRIDGQTAYVGITDFAQHELGDIAYVELPEVGAEYSAGDIFGAIESCKLASDVGIPVSGTVTEVNAALIDAPELVNEDAYENWLICIDVKDAGELSLLLDANAYEALTEEK